MYCTWVCVCVCVNTYTHTLSLSLSHTHTHKHTHTHTGTPAYQAPEMLRDEPISEKVDLYGFGIMLWEMYTGKLPWSDKNYHQMIHTVAVCTHTHTHTQEIPSNDPHCCGLSMCR